MDHMKSDNFGELLAALSGSGNSNGASSNDSHVVHVSGNNASGLKKMHSQPQQLPQQQPDFQHQPQPQYVWQAVPPQVPAQHAQHAQQAQHMMQMPSQLNYGYPISQQMQMPQPMPQHFFPPPPPHQNQTQINQATSTIPIPIDSSAELKAKAVSTKKSFPIVLLTVSLILLGFAVLAVWYYSKKNVLANAVPLLKDSLRNEENEENENEKSRLPPPKLFLVSEQEDDATKLMQDSHVIENLERYLSSPPITSTSAPSLTTPTPTPKPTPIPKPSATPIPTFTSQNQNADEKKRDLKSMPQRSQRPQPQRNSNNSNTHTRFTKLSDVLAEDEDEKVQDEVEVEVNGFKKKMPKRIDSDSPEISEFMKRREQAEKENLKWIESQREKPRVTDDEEENEDT